MNPRNLVVTMRPQTHGKGSFLDVESADHDDNGDGGGRHPGGEVKFPPGPFALIANPWYEQPASPAFVVRPDPKWHRGRGLRVGAVPAMGSHMPGKQGGHPGEHANQDKESDGDIPHGASLAGRLIRTL